MGLSSFQKETIRHQFDSLCKKVLREEYRDCIREIKQRMKHEIIFSELSLQEMKQIYIMDEYSTESHSFNVLNYDIEVKDDLISEVLLCLPKQKCNIILLSYFLEMTDWEIGKLLNMMRSTVQYHRKNSLKQLKKLLEEKI